MNRGGTACPKREEGPQQPNDTEPRAATPGQPQGLDPSVLIAPGIAAIKHAWDIRKDIKAAEAPELALNLAVLDSFVRDQHHVIRVTLRNTTESGIYLENMTVTPPIDQTLSQSILEGGTRTTKVYTRPERVQMGWELEEPEEPDVIEFPGLLGPQSTAALDIHFGLFNQQNHRSHPYALLKIEYSKLNETGPSEISFVIRIRWQSRSDGISASIAPRQ